MYESYQHPYIPILAYKSDENKEAKEWIMTSNLLNTKAAISR